MGLHHLLLIFGSCICLTTYGYDIPTFMKQVDQRCLQQHFNGDLQLLGLTMESFISMVEKVERNHTTWEIYDLARALLKRFAFEGITYQVVGGDRIASQKLEYKTRWGIIKQLVGGDGDSHIAFDEDDLDDVEKCTMFFMMGHLVNTTYRVGRDTEDTEVPPDNGFDTQENPQVKAKAPSAKQPREQGVVSVRGRSDQAVAVSKILNAIVASQHNTDHSIKDLYGLTIPGLEDKQINALQGVTLGDVLANAAIHQKEASGLRYFGPSGLWNSSICPDEFKLAAKPLGTTNSVLRGAVDGLLIASALTNLKSRSEDRGVRLSQLLRMYYSHAGIPGVSASSTNGYSYCRRNEVTNLGGGTSKIQESATAFFIVHTIKELGQIVGNPTDKINRAYNEFNTALGELQDRNEDCNGPYTLDADNPTCETSNNVFVVLDQSEAKTEGLLEQQEVVGLLSHHLDIGFGAGSLNVFLDSKNVEELRSISYNSTNPSCPACHAFRIDQRLFSSGQEGEISVLEGLNKTLAKFERETDLLPGVPGKVAILFHLEDIRDTDKNRVKKAATMVRNGHRDTRVLVVGRKPEILKQMTHDSSDVYPFTDPVQLSKNLLKRICEVPAVLQFNNCWRHTKERQEDRNQYNGYVSPGHVQYWAMYPEYFLKSYDIEFKFTASDGGSIEVCDARGQDNPGLGGNSKNCKKPENGHNTVSFRYKDPCHKYHVDNCPTINFAVRGLPASSGSGSRQLHCPVEDNKCRTIDQIKFTVSHTGVFCSGSEFLKASPLIVLVVALAHFFSKSS